MSRTAREILPGYPHHVMQRGNRRSDVFRCVRDYEYYLELLAHNCRRYGVSTWAYCLMTNHIHLVVVPSSRESLSRLMQVVSTSYAMHANAALDDTGHIWQGRFKSIPLDEKHQWTAIRYVERNPVRARMVPRSEAYRWSSAAYHCGNRRDDILDADFPPAGLIDDWSAWLRNADEAEDDEIRRQTDLGRSAEIWNFGKKT